MKTNGTILALLIAITLLGTGLISHAEPPNIAKKDIPSNIPADVREEIEGLFSSDPVKRGYAARHLGEMGIRAVPAIPFLIEILSDNAALKIISGEYGGVYPSTSPGGIAASALAKIGKPAVEPLIAALKDQYEYVRMDEQRY